MTRAQREFESLRDELLRVGGEIRTVASAAEQRVLEAVRLGEAGLSTRAHGAAAAAVSDITPLANEVTLRIEEQARAATAREQLDEVLNRLRAADERLRASDQGTRRALDDLRSVPEE